jgi:dUTP pyrophosphatase
MLFEKLSDEAVTPHYQLKPFSRALVSTGLKVNLPEGFEGQIRSRSGLAAKHGIFVLNSPATID